MGAIYGSRGPCLILHLLFLKISAHKFNLRSTHLSATLSSEDSRQTSPAEGELDEEGELHTPEPISLKSINLIERHTPVLEAARTRINAEMENMVLAGLDSLVSKDSPTTTRANKLLSLYRTSRCLPPYRTLDRSCTTLHLLLLALFGMLQMNTLLAVYGFSITNIVKHNPKGKTTHFGVPRVKLFVNSIKIRRRSFQGSKQDVDALVDYIYSSFNLSLDYVLSFVAIHVCQSLCLLTEEGNSQFRHSAQLTPIHRLRRPTISQQAKRREPSSHILNNGASMGQYGGATRKSIYTYHVRPSSLFEVTTY